ncbi:NFACT RNA binding domain-containing protein [Eubacteriaceae bacterium ES3]|nr:NFACT RNA binding domain-containing protein [Eubacteriaceae bacterium ES3]
MAFDGITTYHLTKELNDRLKDGRIRKIYQPETDEIRLLVNHGKEKQHLLLSANSSNPRLYITQNIKENPSAPPSFCMSLRKYILNGIILGFEQYQTDRLIQMKIQQKNEFNEPVIRTLIIEIMGRNSNIILLNEHFDILDSLKKVGVSSSRFRQILPGRAYVYPPLNHRIGFFSSSPESFSALLEAKSTVSIRDFFIQSFLGISPAISMEIAFRTGLNDSLIVNTLTKKQKQYLCQEFFDLVERIRSGSYPVIYFNHRKPEDFSTVNNHYLEQDFTAKNYSMVCNMLEDFYFQRDKILRFRSRSASLMQQLDTLLKKHQKKLKNLYDDLNKAQKGEKYRLWGDLITANIYQITSGQKSVTLMDYYDPEQKSIEIPMKVNLSPSQNAQSYYKRYNKSKSAIAYLIPYIETTEQQIYYLESLLNSLEQSTEIEELEEIRHEYINSEFNKKSVSKEDRKKKNVSRPMHFLSSEGFHIYVGKNNYQNDEIATRLGKDEDCWLHVKDAPGSHVLIVAKGKFITEKTLLEAGSLAAWYSRSKGSNNVPVDYVEYKYLKKPPKSKPGMVTFTNQNTMYITPKSEVIDNIERIYDED